MMMKLTLLLVLSAVCCCAAIAQTEIWGVKSHDPVAQPPATLFHFSDSGGPLTAVGAVTVGGSQIDVDGLSLAANGTLYGFEVSPSPPRSRLIRIDTATAAATAVGPYLENREIRGAAIAAGGRLLALDVFSNNLLRFDVDTGLPVGTGTVLSYEGEVFTITSMVDLVETATGELIIIRLNQFFSLSPESGVLTLLYTDTAPAPDGYGVGGAGLAWLPATPGGARLALYDVQMSDDIFAYDPSAGYNRTDLYLNIIPSYNAGRGDLASPPPALAGTENNGNSPRLNLAWSAPNPFGSQATLTLTLRSDSEVQLTVFDLTGRSVRDLVSGRLPAGDHHVTWDGRDDQRRQMPSGLYFCQTRVGSEASWIKLMLAR
jgi:hypothetical protein